MILVLVFLFLFLSSNVYTSDNCENERNLEILALIRQTNSPASQRLLHEFLRMERAGRRNLRSDSIQEPVDDLNEAWIAYENGDKDPLMEMMNKVGFDGNVKIFYGPSLLVMSILKGDLDLVHSIFNIPGIDLNHSGNSGFHPIEYTFEFPDLFNLFLSEPRTLKLMNPNIFGLNPVQQAMKDLKFDLAAEMLGIIRMKWEELSLEEREQVAEMEQELNANLL